MPATALSSSFLGFGDLFSKELRSILGLSVLTSALLLGSGVWALARFAVPLIPDWAGLWGDIGETAAEGAAILVSFALALALWPIVAMVVSSLFFDVAADRLEAKLLPEQARGAPPSLAAGLAAGVRFAAVSIPLNLLALPLYFIPVVNLFVAIGLNTLLLSRENYMLAGLRYGPFAAAERELHQSRASTLLAALPGATVSVIPFAGFVVPLWTLATMVRLRARQKATATES